jgi:predicted transcriptional regulator
VAAQALLQQTSNRPQLDLSALKRGSASQCSSSSIVVLKQQKVQQGLLMLLLQQYMAAPHGAHHDVAAAPTAAAAAAHQLGLRHNSSSSSLQAMTMLHARKPVQVLVLSGGQLLSQCMRMLRPQQRVRPPCPVLQAVECAGSVLCPASGLEMLHNRQQTQTQQQQQ